ncbi:Carbohydrate sulfotransferase 15 [Mizuhopecten yessoensis]|uniref:Carbohydrate sulfotransferase 15 n=1 Tax=Mizuhopecten yessoensis TaxID=6573 RepID=A0A210PSW8_MIZYE|nr:Carbohydrate sulfotransferase 15 [Mizuhopecten yessoensis]
MQKTRTTDQTILLTAIFVVSCVGVGIWFIQLFHLSYHVPIIGLSPSIAISDNPRLRYRTRPSWKVQWRHLLDKLPEVTSEKSTMSKGRINKRDTNKFRKKFSDRRNDWINFSDIILNENTNKSNTMQIDCTHRKLATFSEDILCKKRKTFLKQFKNPCWYEESERKLSCLPYFHLFGVCKSGTTDLFHRITQHPHILKNKGIMGKETWFWSWRRYGNGNMPGGTMYLSQFAKLFDSDAISRNKTTRPDGSSYHHLITGHGEPMDLWDQSFWKLIPQNDPEGIEPNVTTPYLIKYVNPSIKLILILRNPVERLYSHYLHGNYGNSTDNFHRDVLQTIKVLRACQENRTLRSCLYDKDNKNDFKVPISASLYHVHLHEWLKVFPRKQLLIFRTEDYSVNISDTLKTVFSFLNVVSLTIKLSKVATKGKGMRERKGKDEEGKD